MVNYDKIIARYLKEVEYLVGGMVGFRRIDYTNPSQALILVDEISLLYYMLNNRVWKDIRVLEARLLVCEISNMISAKGHKGIYYPRKLKHIKDQANNYIRKHLERAD